MTTTTRIAALFLSVSMMPACGGLPESTPVPSVAPLETKQSVYNESGSTCDGPNQFCLFTWPGTTDQYLTRCTYNPLGSLVCCGGCIDRGGICQDGGSDAQCGVLAASCTACSTGYGCDPAHHACESTCGGPDGSACTTAAGRGTCQNGYCL